MNVIILRNGKELEGPKMSMREEKREVEEENDVGKEVSVGPPSKKLETEKPKEVQDETNALSVKPYTPHVSYPQRLVKVTE